MLDKQNMLVSGQGNIVSGRDSYVTNVLNQGANRSSSLKDLILAIRRDCGADPNFAEFIDELAEYMKERPDSKIIGLEQKLNDGGRSDLLKDAIHLKDKFARKLVRGQLSESTQKIFYHILAHICTVFRSIVKPAIDAKVSPQGITSLIYDEIINKIYSEISSSMTDLTQEHIHGMIYYLTGNCHLDWR